ncbi:T9SS type A sorting domain-containing protein [candidate division FCPU426 bacterium]|nr:T9SS type A sorting domain-containing protein [candidate division FCPU426 bacterium]
MFTLLGSDYSQLNSLILQPDGKLVAAGHRNNDFVLLRYDSGGTLDIDFGNGGMVTTAIGNNDDIAHSVIVQPDGKLVAAGCRENGLPNEFALVRYLSDGSLDTGFGNNGTVSTPIGGINDKAYSLILQSDGKLVAAGFSLSSSNEDFALARYNSDGSLDYSFNYNGKVTTPMGSHADFGLCLVQQDDGKLVLAGNSYLADGFDCYFSLARYDWNGELDASFGSNGKVSTWVNHDRDFPRSILQQPDGKLVVAGYSKNGFDDDYALVRYNRNGSPDTSFGNGGIVVTSILDGYDNAYGLVRQPDGKLVAAGRSEANFSLARYNSDGSLDKSFGSGGKVTTPLEHNYVQASSLVLQPDGKLVVGGTSRIGNEYCFVLVRYNSNGTLDADNPTPVPRLDEGKVMIYPNPCGNIVYFAYVLYSQAKINIDLFNMSGERVARIREDRKGGLGQSLVTTWDCSQVTPGIYLARIVIRDNEGELVIAETRKIAIVR